MILKRFAGALPRASGVKTYGLPDERVSVILAQQKKKSKISPSPRFRAPRPEKFQKKKE